MKERIYEVLRIINNSSMYIVGLSGILFAIRDQDDFRYFDLELDDCAIFPLGNIIFYFSIAVFAFATFLAVRRSDNFKNIDKEYHKIKAQKEKIEEDLGAKIRDHENYQSQSYIEKSDLFKGLLQLIFKNLNLQHTDRISVYKVHERRFLMVGRYSSNPRLEVVGRPWYPIYEGCIGHAWESGDSKLSGLPDPSTDFTNYAQESITYFTIPSNTLEQIKMKSRSYYAKRIEGYDGRCRAIVVIESIEPELQFNKLETELMKHSDLLVLLIERITFADNTTFAAETGF